MTAAASLTVAAEHCGHHSVLRLQGELDVCNENHLRHVIGGVLESHAPRALVVDISGLSFADCAGLSALVWAHDLLVERGDEFVITGGQPLVRRLLALTGLDTYLPLQRQPPDPPAQSRLRFNVG